MEESSDDEEADEDLDDCSSCRSTSPVPKHRQRPVKQNPVRPRRLAPPPPKKRGRPPAVRPPPVCSPRNARDPLFVVPDSPKSKDSVESESKESDVESDEVLGPAVLHFSCLQCHKAKKRCNRTKPCSRCLSRGMEDDCRYPDKHDPRSVLRACLRCWQTKKKCDRKQPSCGKCDKVGVKCVYRRESQDSGEGSPLQTFQVPTPTLTMSPPPASTRPSRVSSDASPKSRTPPPDPLPLRKRKSAADEKPQTAPKKRSVSSVFNDANHHYATRRRNSTSVLKADFPTPSSGTDTPSSSSSRRTLRSRK